MTDHLLVNYDGVVEAMPVVERDITTEAFIEQAKLQFGITRGGWRLIRDDDGSEVPQGALLRMLVAHPSGLPTGLFLAFVPSLRVCRTGDMFTARWPPK